MTSAGATQTATRPTGATASVTRSRSLPARLDGPNLMSIRPSKWPLTCLYSNFMQKCGSMRRTRPYGRDTTGGRMTVHRLKTWPEYFDAIECGDKNFEVRRNDRDFRAGDRVELVWYDPVLKLERADTL